MINIEPAQEMLDNWHGVGDVIRSRAQDVDYQPFDLAISFLTMAFIHPEDRSKLLNRLIYKKRIGGSIVIVEKFIDLGNPRINNHINWTLKEASGENMEDIYKKEKSIAGILRPMHTNEINALECNIDWFFQMGDFAGAILS
jgi:tRNA (cmo5U34)-methyltransferase